jgi:class 3 adenylate cyclase
VVGVELRSPDCALYAISSSNCYVWQAFYVGPTDQHEPKYEYTKRRIPFYTYPEGSINPLAYHDEYSFYIYASSELETRFENAVPSVATVVVACSFTLVVMTLLGYMCYARRRDDKVVGVAAVAGGIVSSLFPSNIRILMYDENREDRTDSVSGTESNQATKPIACLFPDTTVLYADVVGFTEWSAKRPPAQVFILLETLFGRFDRIAHRLGVYKVETIGDCYVAVTGLPDPQPLHAVVMTEFAVECLREMKSLTPKMEEKLGDGTKKLSMRFGLHSGPVTAGVLRGERSRFQLFGETVNIASHIEHMGVQDRIHVSTATARYLIDAGKGRWLKSRTDRVHAEGGGQIQTYWIDVVDDDNQSVVIQFE